MVKKLVPLLLVFILIGCSENVTTVNNNKQKKPVVIENVSEITVQKELKYIGVVESDDTLKYAFKSSGKIEKIYVQQGDFVKEGQLIATLDKEDIQFALDASQDTYDQLSDQLLKAKENYEFYKDQLNKMNNLYTKEAISKQQLDQTKLQYNIAKSDYESAQSALSQAQTDIDQKENLMNNTNIKAKSSGYVLDIVSKSGEYIQAGYPVIVTRSDNTVIKVGVSQKDISLVAINNTVRLLFADQEFTGTVSKVSEVPDSQTRTYPVEVTYNSVQMPLGSLVDVYFSKEKIKGIKIPLDSIMSEGIDNDYVYILNAGQAIRKKIKIESIDETCVFVTGLQKGDQLIISGLKGINPQDEVIITDK